MVSWFANPAFLWFGLFAGVPILLHLLNRYRFRRIRFAPMAFLLASHLQNRRRVQLEQWLLLFLRCVLVVLFVTLVARPVFGTLGDWLSQGKPVALVLDDSCSMAERIGASNSFALAKGFASRWVARQAARNAGQAIALARSSEPLELSANGMDSAFVAKVEETLANWGPTFRSDGPARGIAEGEKWLEKSSTPGELILVSDFRSVDWQKESLAVQRILALNDRGIGVHFVDVGSHQPDNLTITPTPEPIGRVTVGTPFFVSVAVRNQGLGERTAITVQPKWGDRLLPARVIDRLGPLQVSQVRLELTAPASGWQTLTVTTPDDVLAPDNRAVWAIKAEGQIPVLVVDASSTGQASLFVRTALAPGQVRTGLEVSLQSALPATASDWSRFPVTYWVHPESSSESVMRARGYVQSGGSLCLFLGPNTNLPALQALFEGWIGVQIRPAIDATQPEGETFDRSELTGPLARLFAGERNPFADGVRFRRWYPLAVDERGAVLSRLHSQAPMLCHWSVGAGRVILMASSADTSWNNFGENPSFPVAIQEIQKFLTTPIAPEEQRWVGSPWELRWPASRAPKDVRVTLPAEEVTRSLTLTPTVIDDLAIAKITSTSYPGVYHAQAVAADDAGLAQAVAFNVDPKEGALEKTSAKELADLLPGVPFTFQSAEANELALNENSHEPRLLHWLLILLTLIAEQALALRLGYHSGG